MNITETELQIIEKLKQGMGPAEISIEYEKLGENIPASYIRWIKECVKGDCLEFLDREEPDLQTRIATTATTGRQYEKMYNERQG